MGINPLHSLTAFQAREVDRLAIQIAKIPALELMERAGHKAALVVQRNFQPRSTLIACGTGNNGGDGFVIARKLALGGFQVAVWLVGNPERMTMECHTNFARWKASGGTTIPVSSVDDIPAGNAIWNLIIDCLLGTGSNGNPREPIASVIRELNQLPAFRVAIDLPSGLNCDTGQPAEPTLVADLTITMVAEKRGFEAAAAKQFLGRVEVVDLELPDWIFSHLTQ